MNEDSPNEPAEMNVPGYVDEAAHLLDLPLAPEHRPHVIAQFAGMQKMAAPLMTFVLAADVAAAPQFEP